ncbi:hypothetical protein N7466_005334 [Penicillium verhagenii]|uniref:uncharacterized protein n=1 Tax=Penicillium verhagenii TaxID=1562060 RepID=UPI00254506BE|nr:uncharacterized protein N7466_005334 [Penicillium verhagenii]KAJ5935787.1 hypothetical protein N7466_005334 [Penicillium verhagenii]
MEVKTRGLTPTPSGAQWSPESVAVGSFPHAAAVHSWNAAYGFHTSVDPNWRDSSMSPSPPQPTFFDNPFVQPEDEVWNTFTNLGSPGSAVSDTSSPGVLLPGFIQPLPMMMNPTTIEYLYVNDVFNVPSVQLQNALLQAFVDFVFPSMPILDWSAFINAICNRDHDHGSISLFLFYAMMVAATTFVDLGQLQEAGYSSRQEAQEAFYTKAKLLYQSEYEPNTITVVQALLFMTFRLETADGDDSRYWCSIATSTAQSIGLFRDISGATNVRINPKFWKRLAWACYTTDSHIALRLRCQPIIHTSAFCHPILTEDDFEIYNLSPEVLVQTLGHPLSHSLNTQRDLALMCIANTQLCVSILEVLDVQGKGRTRQDSFASLSSHISTDTADHSARVSAVELKLAEWASTFPSSMQTYSFETSNTQEENVLSLQRNLLHMQFYTTIAVFYQSQPLPSSTFCVQYAAQQITQIASELYQKKLHRRLPIVGVTAILVALIIHIPGTKKVDPQERAQAYQNFHLGLEVMTDLQDVYQEANHITTWAFRIMDNAPEVAFSGPQQLDSLPMSVTQVM